MFKKIRRSRTATVGVCCALAGAGAVPVISLAGSISGSTGDGPMVLQGGAATPAYGAGLNVASIPSTTYTANWTRVGDTVHVTGVIPVVPTSANTSTSAYIPLPVASNLNGQTDCNGVAIVGWPVERVARVIGSTSAAHPDECVAEWTPQTTQTQYVHYSLGYRVKD